MSQGPEANFWKTVKKNLPKGTQAWRLENRVAAGMPDCYLVCESIPLWIELKVSKSNKINLSPQQIAWHIAHSHAGGHSLILVNAPSRGLVFLFAGREARSVASDGLRSTPIWSGSSVQEAVLSGFGSGRDHFGTIFGSGRDSGAARPPTHP